MESTACHLPCQHGSFLSLSLAQYSGLDLTCLSLTAQTSRGDTHLIPHTSHLTPHTMPVGRVYQAPAVANPVSRNPQVFGCNGLKSVSNSDLVITGKAVRSKKSKSKSPSPPSKTPGRNNKTNPTETKLTVTNSNRNNNRKSPSPTKPVKLKNSTNITKERRDKVNNNNNNSVENTEDDNKEKVTEDKISNGLCNGGEEEEQEEEEGQCGGNVDNSVQQHKASNGNINNNHQVRVRQRFTDLHLNNKRHQSNIYIYICMKDIFYQYPPTDTTIIVVEISNHKAARDIRGIYQF